jgi:O-antigen biosynthesis protein
MRDVRRVASSDWEVVGPQPLLALVPVSGGALRGGDLRLDLEISAAGGVLGAALLLDTGGGFVDGRQIPLPPLDGSNLTAVVTLPSPTDAIGFAPGALKSFTLGKLSAQELSGAGALLAHALPQVRRQLHNPAEGLRLLGRAARLLRYRGLKGIVERLRRGTERQVADEGYEGWARRYGSLNEAQRTQLETTLSALGQSSSFSVLLTLGPSSESELRRSLAALQSQVYPNWELCMSEDAPVEMRELVQGAVAATRLRWVPANDVLAGARSDFVVRLVPGDVLSGDALLTIAAEFARNPRLALIYPDSDSEDMGGLRAPAFKPNWSPELLHSRDYIGRAAFFRTASVRTLGGWRAGPADVSQHELLLRYTAELTKERIAHVPMVLVHLRQEHAPTAEEARTGVCMLQEFLKVAGTPARAEAGHAPGTYRVRYSVPKPSPPVTVVIPTRDRLALLTRCIHSVRELTTYRPFEILVVDNDSRKRETRTFLQNLEREGAARVLRYPHPFNFSAINNLAARSAGGELLCFLNNDVEAFDPDWLTEMVGLAIQPGVGAVGAKLLYPDNTVQHAGTVAGLFGVAAHGYLREPRQADGYLLQLQTTREVSAVTAACMVVRRDLFLEVGGFDEADLAVAFNDVDLCFKLLRAGYRNLWTPYAELYHRESASRGNDERGADRRRFLREEAVMRERWGDLIRRDPYYSPNLSLDSNRPTPAWPPRFVPPWTAAR